MPFGWVLLDLLTRKIEFKIYKKYCFSYLFETVRIWTRIKQSDHDPYKTEKQDPDL
jgi:hypothetical protein